MGVNASVEDGYDAPVVSSANQASESLLQRQNSCGEKVLLEGGPPLFFDLLESSLNQGVSWRRKGKLVENHTTEGLARNVHPFPKTAGSEKFFISGWDPSVIGKKTDKVVSKVKISWDSPACTSPVTSLSFLCWVP